MPVKRNPPPRPGDKDGALKKYCPQCGGLLEVGHPPAGEELFPDDEFECPACCCGIYVEVKDE